MENTRSVEIEFELTKNDFQRVLLWYHRKRMLFQYFLIIVLGVLFSYFFGINVLNIKGNGWATIIFVSVLSMFLIFDLYRRVFFQAGKLAKNTKPAKMVFSEKGVESKTSNGSSIKDWESYLKIIETEKDFIFFTQKYIFSTVPKRFFKQPDEIDFLRAFIKSKIGKRAKLQK